MNIILAAYYPMILGCGYFIKNQYLWNRNTAAIMIAIYLGMAYLLLFTTFFSNLYDIVRYIMGVVFAVYGVFRGYRLFVGMK